MAEVRMNNLSRIQIPSNRMGAIRDNEVKQLFLNANEGLSLEVVYKTIFLV